MDGYEQDIARQAGGPFVNRQERKTIRRVAEHWVQDQRYYEERKRRLSTYGWWIGLGTPVVIAAIKLVETILGKGT